MSEDVPSEYQPRARGDLRIEISQLRSASTCLYLLLQERLHIAHLECVIRSALVDISSGILTEGSDFNIEARELDFCGETPDLATAEGMVFERETHLLIS